MMSRDGNSITFVSATNAVLHDAEHPSVLILPIVPAK